MLWAFSLGFPVWLDYCLGQHPLKFDKKLLRHNYLICVLRMSEWCFLICHSTTILTRKWMPYLWKLIQSLTIQSWLSMTLKKKGCESILGKEENAFCTVTYPVRIIWPWTSIFGIYLHCRPLLLSTQVNDTGPSWSYYSQFAWLCSLIRIYTICLQILHYL